MYKCSACGAGLVFDPKTQKLQCLYCRKQFDPENLENLKLDEANETEKNVEKSSENQYEVISYKCSHCGAELLTTDETITTFCSFCRTGTMVDRKTVKKAKPDYIIPFKITKEECKNIYINKISKAFFAPKTMIDTQEVEKIRGIYMPYWIYSYEKHGPDTTTGSRYSHRSGDYVYYDDYILKTNIDAVCSGITHDATSNFSDRLSEAIAPYSVKDKKDFSPAYLSGFYADNEDVKNEIYDLESKNIASLHISNKLKSDSQYRKYGATPNVTLENKSTELGLFPVYFLATKNKRGDRISYAVINGQTGKIAADIPIDFKKFVGVSLILAIFLFIMLNVFVTISMPTLIVLSILFNLGSLVILYTQNKKIALRENGIDDKGAQSKVEKEKNIKINKGEGLYKPLLGLLITIIVFLLNPVSDLYYYFSAFFSISMAILSFYNIISKLNILTTRKLPQLGKRGGDENA